jgi:NAD(P)-dependent dehydrogenase (short-subunit alcohol dehydrogenase family)
METSVMMIGQKIVVVGGTAGIGLAVARSAADCGAEVYIGSSNAQRLESALASLQGVHGAVVDVGSEESIACFLSGISEIDHLVSTVGPSYRSSRVVETQLAEAQALYKIKFWGQFLIAKHGAPKLQENGSITLTSGILRARPATGLGVLASVNAGIEALSRTLALELAPRRVNTVCPGFIDTGKLWKDLLLKSGRPSSGPRRPPICKPHGWDSPATPQRATSMPFQNSYVTGQTIIVDGGGSLT